MWEVARGVNNAGAIYLAVPGGKYVESPLL